MDQSVTDIIITTGSSSWPSVDIPAQPYQLCYYPLYYHYYHYELPRLMGLTLVPNIREEKTMDRIYNVLFVEGSEIIFDTKVVSTNKEIALVKASVNLKKEKSIDFDESLHRYSILDLGNI